MIEVVFKNIEDLDGYFSGIVYICADQKYVLEFGYDKEFKRIKLFNCTNPIYGVFKEYSENELLSIILNYQHIVVEKIEEYLCKR